MGWVVFLTFLSICLTAYGQQTCPEKFERMMTCLNRLKQTADYRTIFDRKLDIARNCGATDRNVQCWRSMAQCESQAESATDASTVADDSLKNSIRCYQDNPNNPLAGLESLFHGCHHGKGKKGGPGGPGGRGPPPPPPPRPGAEQGQGQDQQRPQGGIQGVSQMRQDGQTGGRRGGNKPNSKEDRSSEEMKDGKDKGMAAECMPNDMKSLMNCTMQTIQQDQAIISAAQRLRPEVKTCEDMITSDCEPETKPLKMCLKTAMKPYFETFKTNFKTCMSTAGFPFQTSSERPSFL